MTNFLQSTTSPVATLEVEAGRDALPLYSVMQHPEAPKSTTNTYQRRILLEAARHKM
jgi:hypothetical protein